MKPINRITCRFCAVSQNEGLARSIISAFLLPLDPTVEQLADLRCAVSEAVTNCVVHAYSARDGEVFLEASLFEGGRVRVVIRDKGRGIPDVAAAMEPLFTTAPEQDRSGMGFSVMQSFCDKVRVVSAPGKGTRVTLYKRIT